MCKLKLNITTTRRFIIMDKRISERINQGVILAYTIYTVSQKTMHYIFDDNLNKNFLIAIIFGTLNYYSDSR